MLGISACSSKLGLLASAYICSSEAPTVALSFFFPGHQGEVPFGALRNGAVVHYGASITGVN